ncbi:MAG: hypothetical protein J2O48_10515 [Solirubrobacterales bacterium]|nr:hypothetical protein [Solirubrobacterales bacterium]
MSKNSPRLPRFEQWSQEFDNPVSLWDYAARKGGTTLALAFASVFWPRLIEIDGCILLAERYEPSVFQAWKAQLGDRPEAIERTVNHVHLWDLFDPRDEDVPAGELDYLADVLAATWRAALADRFPDRDCEVVIAREAEDYGPTISFFTRRTAS